MKQTNKQTNKQKITIRESKNVTDTRTLDFINIHVCKRVYSQIPFYFRNASLNREHNITILVGRTNILENSVSLNEQILSSSTITIIGRTYCFQTVAFSVGAPSGARRLLEHNN